VDAPARGIDENATIRGTVHHRFTLGLDLA
jgi:hypothetical protein